MDSRTLGSIVALTVALFAAMVGFLLAVSPDLTPTQRGIADALQAVADRNPDTLGVVAIGSSVDRNTLGTDAELSQVLTSPRQPVVAANLGLPAGTFAMFEPQLDTLWAADPDVLVVNPELFLGRPGHLTSTLRGGLKAWLLNEPPADLDTPRCHGVNDQTLTDRLTVLDPYLQVDDRDLAAVRSFAQEVIDRDIAIVWVVPRRSTEWSDATDGRAEQVQTDLMRAVEDFPALGPYPFDPQPTSSFCDFSHLRPDAAAVLRAEWADWLRPLLPAA